MLFLGRILALKSGPGFGAKKRPRIWAPQPGTPLCGTRLGGPDGCPENGPTLWGHPVSLERGGGWTGRVTMAVRSIFDTRL